MKQLYINNLRAVIADDTYFPFTHTISDMENINVIGIPSTKSVVLPRCPQNDEIFGYIADITRINTSTSDNKVGVAFNQTKKTTYSLYNDSDLISTGLVIIENITNTEYSINLYDELIKKLEDISEVYLSDITDLYDNDDNLFELNCNNILVKNVNDSINGIKPVFCVQDTDLGLDKIRCSRYTASTGLYSMEFNELPQDCTPLQLKTFKTYDIPYAISMQTLINNMNVYSGAIPDIIVDPSLTGMTNELYVLTNKPKNDNVDLSSASVSVAMASSGLVCEGRVLNNDTIDYYEFTNGNYYIKIDYHFDFQVTKTQDNIYSKYWNETSGLTTNNSSVPAGTYLGSFWVKLTPFNDYGGDRYTLNPILQRIDLYSDINCQFNLTPTVQYALVGGSFVLNFDYFVKTISLALDFEKDMHFRVEILFTNPENTNNKLQLFGAASGVTCTTVELENGTLEFTPVDFHSGDLINAQRILPKISFKDFLITVAKTFNLDITMVNGNFYLNKKNYYVTDETLLIDSITDMSVSLIDFNKMILTNSLPDNYIIKTYEQKYKKEYAEQVITTGYSIKNNKKDVKFEANIPILIKDVNSFAYDRFTKYWNAGYNKHNYGVINGYDDKLVFGYLNLVNDSMYIVDDLPAEAGFNTNSYTELKGEFGQYSPFLRVNYEATDDSAKWYWLTATSAYGSKLLSHYTFSPYVFSGDTITKSLEMNKPVVNYANIVDANYPDSSTLYYRFHKNMLTDKYNSNTHLLSIKMYVDSPIDIYKIYNYQNSNYIISKIVEYDPTQPGIYDIELMKVNTITNYTSNIIL